MSLQRRRPGPLQHHAPVAPNLATPATVPTQTVQSPLTTTEAAPSGALEVAAEEMQGMGESGDGVAWADPVDEGFVAEDFVDSSLLDHAHRLPGQVYAYDQRIRPMVTGAAMLGLNEELLFGHLDGATAVSDALNARLQDLDREAALVEEGGNEDRALAAASDIKEFVHCLDYTLPLLLDIQASLNRDDLARFAAFAQSLAGDVWDKVGAIWADGVTGFGALASLGASFVEQRDVFERSMTSMQQDALALFLSGFGRVSKFFRYASALRQLENNGNDPMAMLRTHRSIVTGEVAGILKSFSVDEMVEFGKGLGVLSTAVQFVAHDMNASAALVKMDNIVEQLEAVVEVFGPAIAVLQQSEEAMVRCLENLTPMLTLGDRLISSIERVEALQMSGLDRYDHVLA